MTITAIGKCICGVAGEGDGTEQCCIGAGGIETNLRVAHAGDLVACRFNDVGAGFDVGAMRGNDFFRCVFENMGRPERAIYVGAEIFKFRRHAAVEDVDVVKN